MKRATPAASRAAPVVGRAAAAGPDRFETLVRTSPIGIFECDLTGCCTFINDVWETVQQEPAHGALGFGWLARVHPDDRDQFQPGARAFEASSDPVERTFRVSRPGGELRTLRIRLAKLHSPQGVHVGWSGTFEDITEALVQNQVDRVLRRQYEALAELTLRAHPESDRRSLLAIAARCTMDALAAYRVEIVDSRARPVATAEQHDAPRGEKLSTKITDANSFDGTILAYVPVGRPAAIKAVNSRFMDCVADLVSICLERERQQRCLRALFQDSVDAQLRLRADGTILAANSAAARFVGIPQPDLLGRSIEGLGLSERARGAWELTLQQVHASGQALSFEFALQAAAGPVRCSARLLPIPDGTGSTEFVVGTLYDVTDRISHEQLANLERHLHRREDRLDALLTNVLGERAVLRDRARTWGLAGLTPREQTILRQMATGKTNRQIGAELGMSPGTVRNRISLLLPKLGAADRTQAVAIAVEAGLLGTFNTEREPPPEEELPIRAFNLGEFE